MLRNYLPSTNVLEYTYCSYFSILIKSRHRRDRRFKYLTDLYISPLICFHNCPAMLKTPCTMNLRSKLQTILNPSTMRQKTLKQFNALVSIRTSALFAAGVSNWSYARKISLITSMYTVQARTQTFNKYKDWENQCFGMIQTPGKASVTTAFLIACNSNNSCGCGL